MIADLGHFRHGGGVEITVRTFTLLIGSDGSILIVTNVHAEVAHSRRPE